MRVGIFGGSFDPPHGGHLAVARAALTRCDLHRVLLAPVGRQPLKPQGPSAPYADRLAMTELLCAAEPSGSIQASSADAPRPDGAHNYTVDLLERLRVTLDASDELFVITGADAFLDLRRWRSPGKLLQLAEWIVVSRPGIGPERLNEVGLTAAEGVRMRWLGGVAEPVSATEVRARLAAGLDCHGLVPPAVLAYIQEHGLYRATRLPGDSQ